MASRPSIRLVICLAVSVLVHLTVLWPAMGRALAAAPGATDDPPPPIPPMVPPPVEPGIERSDATTLTWVGYEEYREHLARLAEIDQAAFTTATGGAPASAEAAGEAGTPEAGAIAAADAAEVREALEPAEPAESGEPAEPAEPADAVEPVAVADVVDEAPTDASGSDGPGSEVANAAPESAPEARAGDAADPGPRPLVEIAREGPLADDRPALAEVAEVAPDVLAEAEREDDGETDQDSSSVPPVRTARDDAADAAAVERMLEDLRRAVAVLASMAPVGGRGGDAERSVPGEIADAGDGESPPREGEVSDRESPATSRIDVPRAQLRPDRPIAREGLEIRPREPQFLSIERLTASPRNPVAKITFGRDGVPTEAVLLVTTGDGRIDNALISSLYDWRASGVRLTELPPDGTLEMEFRIILGRRR